MFVTCEGPDHAVQTTSEIHTSGVVFSLIGGRGEAVFVGPPFVSKWGEYTRFCLIPRKHQVTTCICRVVLRMHRCQ